MTSRPGPGPRLWTKADRCGCPWVCWEYEAPDRGCRYERWGRGSGESRGRGPAGRYGGGRRVDLGLHGELDAGRAGLLVHGSVRRRDPGHGPPHQADPGRVPARAGRDPGGVAVGGGAVGDRAYESAGVRGRASCCGSPGCRSPSTTRTGVEVGPMRADGARTHGGSRFPAHVDLRATGWWVPRRLRAMTSDRGVRLARPVQAGGGPGRSATASRRSGRGSSGSCTAPRTTIRRCDQLVAEVRFLDERREEGRVPAGRLTDGGIGMRHRAGTRDAPH